jgi:hypothetical protein
VGDDAALTWLEKTDLLQSFQSLGGLPAFDPACIVLGLNRREILPVKIGC